MLSEQQMNIAWLCVVAIRVFGDRNHETITLEEVMDFIKDHTNVSGVYIGKKEVKEDD